MTVARLGNIMLQVAHVEKAFAFYTSVFDFVDRRAPDEPV